MTTTTWQAERARKQILRRSAVDREWNDFFFFFFFFFFFLEKKIGDAIVTVTGRLVAVAVTNDVTDKERPTPAKVAGANEKIDKEVDAKMAGAEETVDAMAGFKKVFDAIAGPQVRVVRSGGLKNSKFRSP